MKTHLVFFFFFESLSVHKQAISNKKVSRNSGQIEVSKKYFAKLLSWFSLTHMYPNREIERKYILYCITMHYIPVKFQG